MNLEEIDYLQKVQRYMMTMRPVFQPHALFSDETANYVEPMEPMPGETVTIRFRAGLNNVDSVFLISGVPEAVRWIMRKRKAVLIIIQ